MKRLLIVGLLGVNLLLLLTLMFGTEVPKAEAQGVIGARTDYLMVTASAGKNTDVVYIIDIRDHKGIHVVCAHDGQVITLYRNQALNLRTARRASHRKAA